jgi:hypothetical protein
MVAAEPVAVVLYHGPSSLRHHLSDLLSLAQLYNWNWINARGRECFDIRSLPVHQLPIYGHHSPSWITGSPEGSSTLLLRL